MSVKQVEERFSREETIDGRLTERAAFGDLLGSLSPTEWGAPARSGSARSRGDGQQRRREVF